MSRVPYASVVGSLLYAMVCTRPDIAHVVGTRALKCCEKDLEAFFGGDKSTLVGNSNSDMAGGIDSRKSTLGYLIKFLRGVVAWQSKMQKCVALSTIEVELVAITKAFKELLWVKKFLQELSFNAIHFGKNSTFHSRSKHIDVRYHWIRDALDAKLLELVKVHIDDNGADMMTKTLSRAKFEACCEITRVTIIST
ncbi:hypothetical protein CR513_30067, partial [Mucuna pruriens]